MENSSRKKTWEEEMYWNHFSFANFSLTLPSNFHHSIALPKKFADNLRTKLPEEMVLKVNGVSWNVNLDKGNNEIMLHGNGWKEFVNAYALKKTDLLVFKYNRRECFEVLIFDRANLCEKESSYFVRKGEHKSSDVNNHDEDHGTNQKTKESSSKELTDTSQEDLIVDCTVRNWSRKNLGRHAYTKDGHNDEDELDMTSNEEILTSEEAKTTPMNAANNARNKERGFSSNGRWKRKREGGRKKAPTGSTSPWCYKSNRREVTEEEIAKTLEKARRTEAKRSNAFLVVMRPSYVYKRFYVTVPAEWKHNNELRRGQEVTLRIEEKTWVCRVCNTSRSLGIQGVGWKNFVTDNFLEEYDVCLFVPSSSKNKSYVFDVCIFRVVPDVVPPTLLE